MITIEDRPATNQIPSVFLNSPFSVARKETAKGWRCPSDPLQSVYMDGTGPILKGLTSVLVGLGVHSESVIGPAGSVFHFIQGGSQTVHGNFARYYEEVSHKRKIRILENTLSLLSL